jgi:serine/threonine protein kinase
MPPSHPTPPPVPVPQPAPSPSIDWISWMSTYWWSYFVIGIVGASVLLMVLIYMCSSCCQMSPEVVVTSTSTAEEFEIDPHVLINMTEIVLGDMIGSGSFAVVYRGFWRKTEVAVKMLQNMKTEKISFLKESYLMQTLRHPNVVSLMGVVLTPRFCIITEYCCNGDVAEMLLNESFMIETEHIRKIALDACRGMTYLHAAPIIHRDLKCRNLLIDKNWNVKVADFGLARGIEEKPGTMTACGTPTHAAPEVIRHSYYTKKADIYSFGICLWEMCTRKEPYDTIPGFRVILAVATKRMRPKIPTTLDSLWANLIRRCWAEDPENRPDFSELVEMFETMNLPVPKNQYPVKEDQKSKDNNHLNDKNNQKRTPSKKSKSKSKFQSGQKFPIQKITRTSESSETHSNNNRITKTDVNANVTQLRGTELETPGDSSSSISKLSIPEEISDTLPENESDEVTIKGLVFPDAVGDDDEER